MFWAPYSDLDQMYTIEVLPQLSRSCWRTTEPYPTKWILQGFNMNQPTPPAPAPQNVLFHFGRLEVAFLI